jgi:hypothetical protein
MDGERRSGDPDWPAAAPGRQVPPQQQYPQQQYPQQQYPQQQYSQGAGVGDPRSAATRAYPGPLAPAEEPFDQFGFGGSVAPDGPGHPATTDPGGRPPDGRGGRGSGGPSRSVVVVSLAVAALAAIGAGTVYALNQPSGTVTTAATTPSAPATTSPPTAASSPSASPSSSPRTSTTTSATVSAGPAPTAFVDNPGAYPGMDFGTVVAVAKKGSGAQITVQRQQFLTGNDAALYYSQHPDQEPLDYAIVDVDSKNHTFTVASDALVYAQYLLGDQNTVTTTQLTAAQFVTKSKAVLSKHLPLLVWMYHKGSANGTVGYLAEQYTP